MKRLWLDCLGIAAIAALLALAAQVRGDESPQRQIEIALALAQAQVSLKPLPVKADADPLDEYWSAREQSLADGWPLIVFVGYQYRELAGKVRTCHVADFPGIGKGPCVIVSVPKDGRMGDGTRLDGHPSDDAIRAALRPKAKTDDAVAKWLSQPLNQGSCGCRQTGGCHCDPHSDCAKNGCKNHNPFLNGAAKPVSAAPVKIGSCPT